MGANALYGLWGVRSVVSSIWREIVIYAVVGLLSWAAVDVACN
jgi:hypothetical protein